MPPTTVTDTPSRTRILALDVARGFAILGTLGTNIWIFSHPGGMLGYLGHPTSPGAAEGVQLAERVLMALPNGKFLGLLTLMFGIGLVIQAESAQRRGRSWPGDYLVRMGLLLGEGLLHYLLIAEFDVLMGYAITGAVVAFVVMRRPRTRLVWTVLAGVLHLLLVWWATWVLIVFSGFPGRDGGESPGAGLYRTGSWWDLVGLRVDNGGLFRVEPIFIGAMTFCLYLVGAELYRRGVFDEGGRGLRRVLMGAGAVAFVADLWLGVTQPAAVLATRYLLAPIVALGLLAFIAAWARHGGGRLGALFAPSGAWR